MNDTEYEMRRALRGFVDAYTMAHTYSEQFHHLMTLDKANRARQILADAIEEVIEARTHRCPLQLHRTVVVNHVPCNCCQKTRYTEDEMRQALRELPVLHPRHRRILDEAVAKAIASQNHAYSKSTMGPKCTCYDCELRCPLHG